MKKIITIVVSVIAVGFIWYAFRGGMLQPEPKQEVVLGGDSANATYRIDGKEYTLENGRVEVEAVSGSASKTTVQLFGNAVLGDLTNDGLDDELVFLTSDGGGSGTFFYMVAAINTGSGYQGTNAVLLGDRIAPQTLAIKNGIAIANFVDRASDEPMVVEPTIGKSIYATVSGTELISVGDFASGEQVMQGYLVWGGETRSFRPCGEAQPEYWLHGTSPALGDIRTTYQTLVTDVEPSAYAPLFATVVGTIVDAPEDGFGADYDYALNVRSLVSSSRMGNCKSDLIVLDEPLAGGSVTSPLVISGRARGSWFFEASFPISIVDWDGRIIAEHYATAEGEWMTTDFVPFTATIEFESPAGTESFMNRGSLILKKDNPSGLPEHDDALEIPIYFAQ